MAPTSNPPGPSDPSRRPGEHGSENGNEIRTNGGAPAGQLWAGVARVDITNYEAGPVNDPLYVKALVVTDGATTAVMATVDAVALAEIGFIRNDYLANVRARLRDELSLEPRHVLINASHCHGVVCAEVEDRTVQAVAAARQKLVAVKVGAGRGHEDRIMENRRLRLRNGREADVRHAYSLPPDAEVVGTGPVDPEIGILRLDRLDGRALAVVYNFACHPIQGVPSGGNTADLSGFASTVIERNLSDDTIALFLQGCAGDINPVLYKDVDHPRNAEPLGNRLGLSTLEALRQIPSAEGGALQMIREVVDLPRADLAPAIASLQAEQTRLLQSLQGTSLNLRMFLHLLTKYSLAHDYPSYYSHRYLHEAMLGRSDLTRLDAANREQIDLYVANIHGMEQLTRIQINLDLLRMHQAQNVAAGRMTVEVEIVGLRIGDFVLLTFPGELSVQIGLDLKRTSPHKFTFVAGYTNGYIYYAPTAEQLENLGGAQEDSDCILAPAWQALFEEKARALLERL